MNKLSNYLLLFFISAGFLFLASCGEDGEDPIIGGDTITLSSNNRTIEENEVTAAPGQTFGVYVSAGSNEVSAVTNGDVIVSGENTATNDSIDFTVDIDAEVGSTATITFTTASGLSEQLTVNVGYQDIVDVVTFADGFSILRAALSDEVLSELPDDSNVTVFAPTDQAFRTAGFNTAADLPENAEDILLYHILDGATLSTAFEAGSQETLEGSDVEITTEGGVAVNGIPVVTADIETADGNIVHVIGSVLSPSSSILNYEAVLLGSQSNSNSGSFYNAIDGEVLTYSQAQANSGEVDFLYYWGSNNNHSIAALDNDGAEAVFQASNNGSTPIGGFSPKPETRFADSDISSDQFDAVSSQGQLEEVLQPFQDTEINQTSVTGLAVGDVFVVELAEERGTNLGLVKVLEVLGEGNPTGFIRLDIKLLKSGD